MAQHKTESQKRKEYPLGTGVIDYFPLALMEVAHISYMGNIQHNGPDAPLHWDRSKSTDDADALMRHFKDRGKFDADGERHSAKMVWRSLAILQKELEDENRGEEGNPAANAGIDGSYMGPSNSF